MHKKDLVLVTGASGFIGRNVAKFCSQAGHEVVGLGHNSDPFWRPQDWGITMWHDGDVTHENLTLLGIAPHRIFHCAGSGSVGFSIEHPRRDFLRSVDSTSHVLEYIRSQDAKPILVLPSSAAVYGNAPIQPIPEESPLNPVSPYGWHKKISEDIIFSYGLNFGIKSAVVRLFSIYGEGLRKQLLWDACRKISGGQTEFPGTGEEIRDFVHVRDAVNLLYKASFIASPLCPIFNGGVGLPVTVKQILSCVWLRMGRSGFVSFSGSTRSGDPSVLLAASKKSNLIGWTPEIKFEEGLNQYIDWYMANSMVLK